MNTKIRCILCEEFFENAEKEHFILKSLGGRRSSRVLDCTDCNHKLANEVDGALSTPLNKIKNLLNIKVQSGSPPQIRNEDLGFGVPVTRLEDGTLIRQKFLRLEGLGPITENGTCALHLKFIGLEDLDNHFDNICAANNISARKLVEALRTATMEVTHTYADSPDVTNLKFNEDLTRRSLAKSTFLYFADCLGREIALEPQYDPIRNFILKGLGPQSQLTEFLPEAHKPDVSSIAESGANHWIALYCLQKGGPVSAVISIFNFYTVRVDLCKSGTPGVFGYLHDVDPLEGIFCDVKFDPRNAQILSKIVSRH